jgi:hypothetical protein
VVIDGPPQVAHHLLADLGGEVLLRVMGDGSRDGENDHGYYGEIQHRELIGSEA